PLRKLEKERRRLILARRMATREKFVVPDRIVHVNLHLAVPAIGALCKLWVKLGTQLRNWFRQWIAEILVLSLAEAMAGHHDATTKKSIIGIPGRDVITLLVGQKTIDACTTEVIKFGSQLLPVKMTDAQGGRDCGSIGPRGSHGREFHVASLSQWGDRPHSVSCYQRRKNSTRRSHGIGTRGNGGNYDAD